MTTTIRHLQAQAAKLLRLAAAWLETADLAGLVAEPALAQRLGVLCPAYFDPVWYATGWPALAAAASKVPVIAVAPDAALTTHLAEYRVAFAAVQAAGGVILGYVHTRYGTRPEAEVKAEVRLWHDLYPGLVTGIFFDTSPTDQTLIPLYQRFASHARAAFGVACRLVFNPGDPSLHASWGTAIPGAIWVTSEVAGYAGEQLVPPWPGEFAALRYRVSEVTARAVIAAARAAGVEWVYCTSDVLKDPWDTLPPYWAAEVAAVAAAK